MNAYLSNVMQQSKRINKKEIKEQIKEIHEAIAFGKDAYAHRLVEELSKALGLEKEVEEAE